MLRKCLAIFVVVFAMVGATTCANQSSEQASVASDSDTSRE